MNELNIIEQVANKLKKHAKLHIVYITAELNPYSNAQRPDLVIFPENGNLPLFVEFRIPPKNGFKLNFWQTFDEKKDFVESSSEVALKYIFATTDRVNKIVKSNLLKKDIFILDKIQNPEDFEKKIIDIMSAAPGS